MLRFTRLITRSTLQRFLSTTSHLNQIKSSCVAGTPLNLKIKKSGPEPVALDDSQYPEWLWDVLDAKKQQEKLAKDPAKLAKKEMRNRNRQKIKMNNFMTQMK